MSGDVDRRFELYLFDTGKNKVMKARIFVGKGTTPEMLDEMIATFESMKESLYETARKSVRYVQNEKKEVQDA